MRAPPSATAEAPIHRVPLGCVREEGVCVLGVDGRKLAALSILARTFYVHY